MPRITLIPGDGIGPDIMESARRVIDTTGVDITWEGKPASLNFLNDVTERKRAEEALSESEERFRDLFENANDMIQSVDINGSFVYVNRKWLETLGYSEKEVKKLRKPPKVAKRKKL